MTVDASEKETDREKSLDQLVSDAQRLYGKATTIDIAIDLLNYLKVFPGKQPVEMSHIPTAEVMKGIDALAGSEEEKCFLMRDFLLKLIPELTRLIANKIPKVRAL